MLTHLTIHDLAVVASLDLSFCQGFSVLTGETGAGKSILLTALGLALGDRADTGLVRPGAKRAQISLTFDLSDAKDAETWLSAHDLELDEQLIVRRTINPDGRSKAFVNDTPVTLRTLKELSENLLEIHGQHGHLQLLKADHQRWLLDSYANHAELLTELAATHRRWRENNKKLKQLSEAADHQQEREALLRFQLDELQQLDLERFDYSALVQEHDTLANVSEILATGHRQLDRLYENQEFAIHPELVHCQQELQQLSQFAPELSAIASVLAESQVQVEDAAQQLRRYLDGLETNPAHLEQLAERIGLVQNLSRKHKVTPEQLPELARTLADELAKLGQHEAISQELTEQVARDFDRYQQLSQQLSDSRGQAARRLAEAVSSVIQELGMAHGLFEVAINHDPKQAPGAHGQDSIEFLIQLNPGLPAKPLAKVASGGELARIGLAIQVTTSHDRSTPTMIFDEVDSGIGGGIAEIVGQKLRQLSAHRQVICVTHLPQVAAQAHQHLFVAKQQNDRLTTSTVRVLDTEQRVEEIARMLGGVTLTENTRAHAREMLSQGALTL
ncbi:MAG: DNA repair protein RecN [Methylococcales bacterium]|nr:DNA repair protein RecN [Methylococcales bacterium]